MTYEDELQYLKSRVDRILNEILIGMKEAGLYMHVDGYNRAWAIIDDLFDDELRRVASDER